MSEEQQRPRLNAEWHRAHPMPPRATLDERVEWHVEHSKACGCREMPASIAEEARRRGRLPS